MLTSKTSLLVAVAALGGLAIALLAGAAPAASTPAPTLPPGFHDTVVVSGLQAPTAVRFSPDGRVFVAEQSGKILAYEGLDDTTPTVLADLSAEVDAYWDRGLLGLALDPGFPAKPYVYVTYTYDALPAGGTLPQWADACPALPGPTTDGCVVTGRLSRLTVDGNTVTDEKPLITDWCQQFPSHSIGDVGFGADGALYVSGGDGASFMNPDYGQFGGSPGSPTPPNPCGDPPGGVGGAMAPPAAEGGSLRSQSLRRPAGEPVVLSGTVARVDPATGDPLPDNPLMSSLDANAQRIVAYGLRNPFRFAFRPGTSELWIGDVGEDSFEEIDRVVSPLSNFGWPCFEGPVGHATYLQVGLNMCATLDPADVTQPFFSYNHSNELTEGGACSAAAGSSITALSFYAGTVYPVPYRGALFFADRSRNCIWTISSGADRVPDPATVVNFEVLAGHPVDLEPGPGGDLFYVDYDNGAIHRITYHGPVAIAATTAPIARDAPATVTVAADLPVSFDAGRSTSPDGGPLTYAWDLDGDGVFGDSTEAAPSFTYAARGTYVVRVKVTDDTGVTAVSSPLTIRSGDAPVPTIEEPDSATTWHVGQTIPFAGHATDTEDGPLLPSALTWTLVLHHCATLTSCHTHTVQSFQGMAQGSISAPDHEYPSFLELRLTATDSDGLASTTSVELKPQTVDLRFDSTPVGATLVAGPVSGPTPFSERVIVGSALTLSAASPQTLEGAAATFSSWSDGGVATHTIVAPAVPATYVASFATPVPPAPPGGGGGGGLPDLVTSIAFSPARADVGGEMLYMVVVHNVGVGGSEGDVLALALPDQVTVVSSYADRGPGCSGTTTLSCYLDFLSSGQTANVVVRVRVERPGALLATATVRSQQPDAHPDDNVTSLRVVVDGPPPPPAPLPPVSPPRVVAQLPHGRKLLAVRAGSSSRLRVQLRLTGPALLSAEVFSKPTAPRHPVVLQSGTRLGPVALRRPADHVAARLGRAGAVTLDLRLAARSPRRATRYWLVVDVSSAGGHTSTAIPFEVGR